MCCRRPGLLVGRLAGGAAELGALARAHLPRQHVGKHARPVLRHRAGDASCIVASGTARHHAGRPPAALGAAPRWCYLAEVWCGRCTQREHGPGSGPLAAAGAALRAAHLPRAPAAPLRTLADRPCHQECHLHPWQTSPSARAPQRRAAARHWRSGAALWMPGPLRPSAHLPAWLGAGFRRGGAQDRLPLAPKARSQKRGPGPDAPTVAARTRAHLWLPRLHRPEPRAQQLRGPALPCLAAPHTRPLRAAMGQPPRRCVGAKDATSACVLPVRCSGRVLSYPCWGQGEVSAGSSCHLDAMAQGDLGRTAALHLSS